jgi:hypothetical protein
MKRGILSERMSLHSWQACAGQSEPKVGGVSSYRWRCCPGHEIRHALLGHVTTFQYFNFNTRRGTHSAHTHSEPSLGENCSQNHCLERGANLPLSSPPALINREQHSPVITAAPTSDGLLPSKKRAAHCTNLVCQSRSCYCYCTIETYLQGCRLGPRRSSSDTTTYCPIHAI